MLKFDIRSGITWGLFPAIPSLFDCVNIESPLLFYLERTPQYWDVLVSMVIASL